MRTTTHSNIPKIYGFKFLLGLHFIGGVLVPFFTVRGGIRFSQVMAKMEELRKKVTKQEIAETKKILKQKLKKKKKKAASREKSQIPPLQGEA